MATAFVAWGAVLFSGLLARVRADPIIPRSCTCGGCRCAGGGPGCDCRFNGDDEGGICSGGRCLDRALIVCMREYDPDLGSRPVGSECKFSYSGFQGLCLPVQFDGSPMSEGTRCVSRDYAPCMNKRFGDSCNEYGTKQCGYPNNSVLEALECIDGLVAGCLKKPDGTTCSITLDPLDKYGFVSPKTYTSRCRAGRCVDAEDGACVGKTEGEACDWMEYSRKAKCISRGKGCGGYKSQLWRKTINDGVCLGAQASNRECKGGGEYEELIEEVSGSSSARPHVVLALVTMAVFLSWL